MPNITRTLVPSRPAASATPIRSGTSVPMSPNAPASSLRSNRILVRAARTLPSDKVVRFESRNPMSPVPSNARRQVQGIVRFSYLYFRQNASVTSHRSGVRHSRTFARIPSGTPP